MSLDLTSGQNPILTRIIRCLHTHDFSIDKLYHLIEDSTIEQLVTTFAFLNFWVTSNTNSEKTREHFSTQQSVRALISYIVQKVPPINLLAGISDLKWEKSNLNLNRDDMYQHVLSRLNRIKQIFLHYYNENSIFGIPFIFDDSNANQIMKLSSQLIELETDSSYRNACSLHFKRLLLSHCPLSEFKRLLSHRHSRFCLSESFISMSVELNLTDKASQNQLLYSFSRLFLYFDQFARSKDIDGQLACEKLQALPYLSPYCLLAFVNHIPHSLYLFNLLIPYQLIQETPSLEKTIEIVKENFQIVDRCTDSRLSELTNLMPRILSNYFLSQPQEPEGNPGNDDLSLMINLHIYGPLLQHKMRRLIEVARVRDISTECIAGLNSQLLYLTAQQILKTFVKYENRVINDLLIHFFYNVISLLLPTHYYKIIPEFFKIEPGDRVQSELLLRSLLKSASHLIPSKLAMTYFIPYCIKVSTTEDGLTHIARIFTLKLFNSADFRVPNELKNALIECSDPFILLAFLETSDHVSFLRNIDERNKLEDLRKIIMKKLPFRIDHLPMLFISNAIPNPNYQPQQNALIKDYAKIFDNEQADSKEMSYFTIYFLANSLRLKDPNFANKVARDTVSFLKRESDITNILGIFEYPIIYAIIPIAQCLVRRLLKLTSNAENRKYSYLAEKILSLMSPLLINDKTTLHWLLRFIVELYPTLTDSIKAILNQLLTQLPFYVEFHRNNFNDSLQLLSQLDQHLYSGSERINSEYSSSYLHARSFLICSILLSDLTMNQIIDRLSQPAFDVLHSHYKDRRKCCSIAAHVAASLPFEFAYSFFLNLFSKPLSEYALESARIFVIFSTIEVFIQICKDCEKIIKKNSDKLTLFMESVLPSMARLMGSEDVATILVCGFLKSLTTQSPKYQQDDVIDAVVLIYSSFGLQNQRKTIIQSPHDEPQFPHELKEIIASSLI